MKKYRAIVIGCGSQGALADAPGSGNEGKIISYCHALKEHPGFEPVAIVDKSFNKAEQAEKIWGIPAYFIPYAFYPDNYHDIDIAIIATPDDTHYEVLKELADKGLSLVIVEKPLTTNLDQAREIVELYRAKGVPLMVNYTRRFLPYHRELRDKWISGGLGGFLGGNFVFNRGWLHTGSHMVDFIRWFFGFEKDYMFPVREINTDYRIWQMEMFFQKYLWREERIDNQPVWDYYDQAMYHVVNHAFEFLEGHEPLVCSGEDALKTLEVCFKLMGKEDCHRALSKR